MFHERNTDTYTLHSPGIAVPGILKEFGGANVTIGRRDKRAAVGPGGQPLPLRETQNSLGARAGSDAAPTAATEIISVMAMAASEQTRNISSIVQPSNIAVVLC